MNAIDAGRAACQQQQWGDAWRLLAEVDLDALDVDGLDAFATAAYLTGHDEDGFALWGRAYQSCVSDGMMHRAASFGMRLVQGLFFRGDLPRSRGWTDRTARLLEAEDIDCVEQGYLEHALGMGCLFDAGDISGAHAHFVQAGKVGTRFAHRELITLARIAEGRMLIYVGDIAEGVALLDEAMVSIESGDLSPLATGDAYCTVIDACAELLDIGRCRAWSESFVRWCDVQQDLVLYRGHCFLHRAEVLGMSGHWRAALEEARCACDRLAEPVNPGALAAACVIEGDLLRLLGDLEGAERAYERATHHGRDPQPGLALLRLEQGNVQAADAAIRRALGEAEDPISRARLLDAYVGIVLDEGDSVAAQAAADELAEVARVIGTPLLRARAARAGGRLRLAGGDPASALPELRRAFHGFNELGVRYDAACTRLAIAEACRSLGDEDAASWEAASAASTFEDLRTGGASAAPPAVRPDGLTARELEVLELLAQGGTNRVIAQTLVISEKTVASHVSHIFTKLGLTSRSAATAYAYDHGVVGTDDRR